MSGWVPNPLRAWRSNSTVLDQRTRWVDIGNPTQHPASFFTQPSYVFRYAPAHGMADVYVYMADDWVTCGRKEQTSLREACYTWLPMQIDESNSSFPIRIGWRTHWDVSNPFAAAPRREVALGPLEPPKGPKECKRASREHHFYYSLHSHGTCAALNSASNSAVGCT